MAEDRRETSIQRKLLQNIVQRLYRVAQSIFGTEVIRNMEFIFTGVVVEGQQLGFMSQTQIEKCFKSTEGGRYMRSEPLLRPS